MGGSKPFAQFRGRPLVTYPFGALSSLCGEVVVAHGPALDPRLVLALPSARFVPDPGQGPLPALLAAAEAAKGEWLLIAPCDSPFVTRGMYEELLGAVGQREGACYSVDGMPQPLVAALRREEAAFAFREALDRGRRSPREALARIDVVLVPGAAQDLLDLDTPQDVRDAEGGR